MNNKEIIKIVDDLTSMSGFSESIIDDGRGNNDKSKIGVSQFRDIANICKKTQCCEEIKLFIQYKTSKRNGWDNIIGDKHKDRFGTFVIKSINEIENKFGSSDDESKKIEAISKFFGYLFWKAKVVKNN